MKLYYLKTKIESIHVSERIITNPGTNWIFRIASRNKHSFCYSVKTICEACDIENSVLFYVDCFNHNVCNVSTRIISSFFYGFPNIFFLQLGSASFLDVFKVIDNFFLKLYSKSTVISPLVYLFKNCGNLDFLILFNSSIALSPPNL